MGNRQPVVHSTGNAANEKKSIKELIQKAKEKEISSVNQNLQKLNADIYGQGNTNTIISSDNFKVLQAVQVASNQINRGGDNFTKDDMIAILLFLQTCTSGQNMFVHTEAARAMTRNDLVANIRTIVFDPVKIEKLIMTTNKTTTMALSGEMKTLNWI